jgi:hypothetical protein
MFHLDLTVIDAGEPTSRQIDGNVRIRRPNWHPQDVVAPMTGTPLSAATPDNLIS